MKRINTLLVMILLSVSLIGCGASKTQTNSSGSLGTTPWGAPIGNLAECNQINTNSIGLAGVVSSFYDPATATYRDDLGRLYFTQVPSDLAASATKYLQVFRWQVNTSTGAPLYQTTPVNLVFLLRSTGQILNYNSPVTTLSQSTLATAITNFNLSLYGITPANFFQFVVLIATGLSPQDNAYRISIFDSAVGATPQGSADSLMPPFYADPAKYRQFHPYAALYDLHPMNSLGFGLPESTYVDMSLTYCQAFF